MLFPTAAGLRGSGVLSPSSRMSESKKYRAFISYSHADEAWAKWLHRALETYRVPARLRRGGQGELPKRLLPIFRDRDELPSAAELGSVIQEALRQSETLIVICSPRAASSRWVNEEIRYFKSLGRGRQVLALIVSGEPHATDATLECFPPALRQQIAEDGSVVAADIEPIAADVRAGGDGRSDALLKLIAGLLGVGLDQLKQREAQRQRWRRIAMAALVAAVLTSLLGVWQWQRSEKQQALEAQALQVRRAALYENGRRELLAGQQARAAVYLVGALQLGLDTPALRFMLGRAMREVDAFQQRYELGAPVNQMRLDSSGTRLAAMDVDGTLHVLDTKNGREISTRSGEPFVWSDGPYFAQGGKTLLNNVLSRGHSVAELLIGASDAATWRERRPSSAKQLSFSVVDNHVAYIDAREQARIVALGGSAFERSHGPATAVALLSAGQQLLVGTADGAVRRLRTETGAILNRFEGLSESVRVLRVSPDGQLLAAGGISGEVRVWELQGGRLRFTASQPREVDAMEFSADSQHLLTSGGDGNAVWDTRRGQLLFADKSANFVGNPAGFVHGGDWLAQIKDGNLTLKDAVSAQELLNLDGHNGPPDIFATGNDPAVLYSGGSDGSVVRWQLPTANLAAFDAQGAAVGEVEGDPQVPIASAPTSGLFAFGRADGVVQLHCEADASLLKTLTGRPERVTAVAFSSDGQWLAAAYQQGAVAVWAVGEQAQPQWLQGPGGAPALLRWAPDGRHLAGAFLGARTRVWHWPDAAVVADFSPRDATKALAFSPDGRRLAIGQQGHARLWDLAQRAFVWEQALPIDEGEEAFTNVFDFSPDGRQLLASLKRRKLFLLDVATGRIDASTSMDSSSNFSSGGFSPDGTSIVIGDYAKLAYRWTPSSGRVMSFEAHTAAVSAAISNPQGSLVATASDDGTVKVWDAATGALLDSLIRHLGPIRYGNLLYSRDGRSLLSAGQDQRVELHALPHEPRSAAVLQQVIACKTTWTLVGEGLQRQAIKPADCGP